MEFPEHSVVIMVMTALDRSTFVGETRIKKLTISLNLWKEIH